MLFGVELRLFSFAAWCSGELGDDRRALVVVGGGAAGVYGALRAKSLCPSLDVLVLEKGQLLSKVYIPFPKLLTMANRKAS